MDKLIPDIPRLYTAIAEFMACIIYILLLKKRFKPIATVGVCAVFAGLFALVQLGGGKLPLLFWVPVMIVAMLTVYAFMFTSCREKPLTCVYFAARAFVIAEFAASVEWQLDYFLNSMFAFASSPVAKAIVLIIVYGAVFVVVYLLERRYKVIGRHTGISYKDLFAAVVIAVVIFTISNLSFVNRNSPLSGANAASIFYIRTLVDLCGVILMFVQQEQRLSLHARREVDAMQKIFSHQYDQYVLQKDNIERLNRRYHDFKHQVAAIKAEENPEKRKAYLEEMENDVRIYEASYNTGNRVLDTLLTGKGIYCAEHDINFTCVADGEKLEFMDVMDLCSIVGNALDNAVESVEKLNDEQKRLVKVAIYSQNNLLILRFENYIETSLKFVNGLPETTKIRNEHHGYGLKSIKNCAEKYGGSMKIVTQFNWFVLSLLIPIPLDVNQI